MPPAVLALDQGTTGSTALVFGTDGAVLARSYAEIGSIYPQPGWVEQDPEEIWRVSLRVMARALRDAGVGGPDLRAIGITNQRETTVVWERAGGRPVHPAIVWQSRQTAPLCAALRAEGKEALFQGRTGLRLDPYFSGTKLRFVLDSDPRLRERAGRGELAFGTVDSWLLFRLTGGRVHATEPTNASRTLLYDIHTRRFDPELLAALEVPAEVLPEVRPSAGFFGDTVGHEGLPPGVPVTGMAGDQQAALFGQGCWEAGMAKNTYGTGCFLVMNTGPTCRPSTHGLLTTLCCDARGAPAYALEGSVFVAGAAIQWLRDELGLVGSAPEASAVAARVRDSGGVYVVPAFVGLGAPYWDPDARGAIFGLTRGTGREQIVRATVESLAYQTRDVVEAMNADSGVPLRELRADGGASASDVLMQFQADLLGVPVERPVLLDTTAAGAAGLAGLGAGVWPSPEVLAGVRRRERLFTPALDAARRESLYAGWREAVARTLSPRRARGRPSVQPSARRGKPS